MLFILIFEVEMFKVTLTIGLVVSETVSTMPEIFEQFVPNVYSARSTSDFRYNR